MADWTDYFTPIAAGSQGQQGIAGTDGTYADTGLWESGIDYTENQRVTHALTGHGLSTYRCWHAHHASSANEPNVGPNWEDYWLPFAEGGQDGLGSGDVVGPSSSVANDDVGFADVTGKLLKSMGAFATRLATALAALTATSVRPDGDVDTVPLKIAAGQRQATVDTLFTRYVTIPVKSSSMIPAGLNKCGDISTVEIPTNKHTYKVLPFVHTGKTSAQFDFPLPEKYDGGPIKAYITWWSSGTTSNGVRWGVQGSAIGDNDSADPVWGSAVEVTDNATGTAYKKLRTSVMDNIILQGTPTGGEDASIQVYRDPTHGDDSLDEAADLISIRLIIGINGQSEVP